MIDEKMGELITDLRLNKHYPYEKIGRIIGRCGETVANYLKKIGKYDGQAYNTGRPRLDKNNIKNLEKRVYIEVKTSEEAANVILDMISEYLVCDITNEQCNDLKSKIESTIKSSLDINF